MDSLVGYSPWGHKDSDMTEVTQHSCIQQIEKPLQYYCLGHYPTDKEAWWATVHGVAKSQTRLSD